MRSLIEFLEKMPDFRRAQGQRFPFAAMVEIIVLGGLSGRFGINPLKRFIENNTDFLVDRYNLLHGPPSGTAMYNFMSKLDYKELNESLKEWTAQYIDEDDELYFAIDGKALRSTGEHCRTEKQNFKRIVSIFCTKKHIVIDTKSFNDSKTSEPKIARELIERLELQGVTMTLDALHCEKKHLKVSWSQEMIL